MQGRLILLEPRQADLPERICAGKLITADEFRSAGAFNGPDDDAGHSIGKGKKKKPAAT